LGSSLTPHSFHALFNLCRCHQEGIVGPGPQSFSVDYLLAAIKFVAPGIFLRYFLQGEKGALIIVDRMMKE
jgi:hypothetical protein